MKAPLHVKYRPQEFKEVVGQKQVIASLQKMVAKRGSQAYLFSGPSGVGKTTLARIVARVYGCKDADILEIDAATNTGIEAMRRVQDILRYKPFGAEIRFIILDEAHGLSRQSWESLLKSIEEPPEHVVWCFCTTQLSKVPATIKTRCASYTLKAVNERDLQALAEDVCDAEKIEMPDDVMDLVISEAQGSPRQLLVNLAMCAEVETRKGAAEVLRTATMSDPVLELCRFLAKGGSWMKVMGILSKLEDQSAEGVRIVVSNYFASVVKGAKSENSACAALAVLEEFATSYNPADGMAPLYLSVGRVIYRQ